MLKNRVVLVTGAASGIGREIAERFLREGARVTGFDRVGEVAIHGDVRSPTDVERAVDQVVDSEGRIDVLVNSAGVREIGDVYTMATEEWDNVIAVNLSGTFYCCQAAARRMRESAGGVIVNVSSVGGLIGLARRPAYTAAKHAVIGLTKSLARDLGPAGIRVNALCPGLIRTPLTEHYFAEDAFEEGLRTVVPQGRAGTAADVADAALFLASDQSAYVNGVALTVDGGWLAEKSFAAGEAAAATFLATNETADGRDTRRPA
ncbi:MAG: meso-butanediol dehydrogenase / (S,S)-butanediol dehydrogenase / diacetyl reductase [Gaiellaceae bacterium]|jgi:NAD(P)-dependent dehydrogenase (short-subunit alcohol dehydrogenase family)|nr:meso-butanediol dehydrogenase / (S,S)-butanediol dehydrogenase / diacetyl reductase [Gaiellaceae bacterium]